MENRNNQENQDRIEMRETHVDPEVFRGMIQDDTDDLRELSAQLEAEQKPGQEKEFLEFMEDYEFDENRICRGFGAMSGQHAYVVKSYYSYLHGCWDEITGLEYGEIITMGAWAQVDEYLTDLLGQDLPDGALYIVLWFSSDGFVSGQTLDSKQEAETWFENLEKHDSEINSALEAQEALFNQDQE